MGKYEKGIKPQLEKVVIGAVVVGFVLGAIASILWELGAVAIGAPLPGLINLIAGIGFVALLTVTVTISLCAWVTA